MNARAMTARQETMIFFISGMLVGFLLTIHGDASVGP